MLFVCMHHSRYRISLRSYSPWSVLCIPSHNSVRNQIGNCINVIYQYHSLSICNTMNGRRQKLIRIQKTQPIVFFFPSICRFRAMSVKEESYTTDGEHHAHIPDKLPPMPHHFVPYRIPIVRCLPQAYDAFPTTSQDSSPSGRATPTPVSRRSSATART